MLNWTIFLRLGQYLSFMIGHFEAKYILLFTSVCDAISNIHLKKNFHFKSDFSHYFCVCEVIIFASPWSSSRSLITICIAPGWTSPASAGVSAHAHDMRKILICILARRLPVCITYYLCTFQAPRVVHEFSENFVCHRRNNQQDFVTDF